MMAKGGFTEFKCECGETSQYEDLPSPKIAFVGMDIHLNPYVWKYYIFCKCGKRAYETEEPCSSSLQAHDTRQTP